MCRCLVKYLLFSVNLIFTLVGLALVGLGIYVVLHINDTQFVNGVPINVESVPYVIIGFGVLVFLISFAGCCGSVTESKCLLITYAVCMGVFAVGKIILTILLFRNLDSLQLQVQIAVNRTFVDPDPSANATFHAIEKAFKCCGTTGPDSYISDTNLAAPTCCEQSSTAITGIPDLSGITNITDISDVPGITDIAGVTQVKLCPKAEAYPIGCTRMLADTAYSYLRALGIAMIVLIVYEVVALIAASYLVNTITPKFIHENRPITLYVG